MNVPASIKINSHVQGVIIRERGEEYFLSLSFHVTWLYLLSSDSSSTYYIETGGKKGGNHNWVDIGKAKKMRRLDS